MIITKQKDLKSIICLIQKEPVFIVGCSQCATLCKTGGEDEVKKMSSILKEKNIKVTGCVILDPACHLLNNKRILNNHKDKIKKSKKVLVLACGNGVQTVAEIIDDAEIIPGLDTLFLGEIKRINKFEKRCNLCGDCIQNLFDGICPISRCPKNMLNGPCGGSINGKCEVSKDIDCIWETIIKKLDKEKKLFLLKKIVDPKKWSKSLVMQR